MTQEYLAIVGPTASGKTDLGLKIAREQNGEIISVDSRQVYRHLSIGTAKPVGQWLPSPLPSPLSEGRGRRSTGEGYVVHGIPYHLVDFLEPDQYFTAAEFVRLATEKIQEVQSRGKTPIFVGGTGLYYKALTEGLADLPPADAEIRARLKKEADESGRPSLHARLARIDPEAASKIPANNIQRLIRALEVFEITGKPISRWHEEHQAQPNPHLSLRCIGLDIPRDELNRRIEARCRTMLEAGMIQETQDLLSRGYPETCPALTGLGYPRIIALLKKELTQDACLTLLIQDSRQYAKRQMTWFRHQLPVEWKK